MRGMIFWLLAWGVINPLFAANTLSSCDRPCLIDTMNGYVDALVRHDPAAVRWSARAQTVENLESIKPGDGLWKTASAGLTAFRIVVADPVSQSVGAIVMLSEAGAPIEVALRLQLDQGEILAVHHLVARDIAAENLRNLASPRPALLTDAPEGERMTRAEMLRIAAAYYQAVAQADGNLAPFAPDCVRHESGWRSTTNPPPASPPVAEPGKPLHRDLAFQILGAYGCAEQLNTRIFANISGIDDRRIDIADPQTGLVFAFSHFRHAMKERIIALTGVPGVDSVDWDLDPFDLYAAHIIKITDGKIHEIEATGALAAYNSPPVW